MSLLLQDIWRSDSGRQEEVTILLERHQRLLQSAVSSLHPVPLLRLHVPCHHIRRSPWGGNKRQHSEYQSLEGLSQHWESNPETLVVCYQVRYTEPCTIWLSYMSMGWDGMLSWYCD